jgi:undecaprenyl pyrophosphate phosphatase UppP
VTSHFLLLSLFAFLVAVVFAVLMRDQPREQLRFGAMVFAAFLLSALVLGWIMLPFPL